MNGCPACGSRIETSELPLLNGRLAVIFACTYCHFGRSEEFVNKFDYHLKYNNPARFNKEAICDDPCSKDRCTKCVNQPENQQTPYVGLENAE
jgi:hypothetical protein